MLFCCRTHWQGEFSRNRLDSLGNWIGILSLGCLQATGLAELENSPSVVFFEALQKQANRLDDKLSQDQKEAIKGAFKKLGYEDYGKKV